MASDDLYKKLTVGDKKQIVIHEDWVAVTLGLLLTVIFLSDSWFALPVYNWDSSEALLTKIFAPKNIWAIVLQLLLVAIVAVAGAILTNKPLVNFIKGFLVLCLLTIVALVLSGSSAIRAVNLESVIISLLIGLLISNFFTVPLWLQAALSAELYIKIGLVLLGTSIIFGDILKAGSLGLLQAFIVVISVWYFAYWVAKKLKVDDELTVMLASAVSICGVSAAIATAGAIKGDAKKLSYVVSLVLVTAIPMMIGMPYIAEALHLSQQVTGAWLGGTIDTTGAVVASGTLVGEGALKTATIVKFSQNVLLGVAAFAISVYWSYTKKQPGAVAEKPTLQVIWQRFPKFVFGFIGTSLLFSFVIPPALVAEVKAPLKTIQGLWFTMAFTSIGLETKFNDLIKQENRKPLYAFLIAQSFNIIITLLIAYLLFK